MCGFSFYKYDLTENIWVHGSLADPTMYLYYSSPRKNLVVSHFVSSSKQNNMTVFIKRIICR